ncbi:MAG: serine--tRNA ligase [Oscillospiraceae bacterium]|nr:serine--tRNA ligase [Oscillospiraceae bacterium]
MLDIKFVRENPDAVKENIRKKFQNAKLPLVDEAIALDAEKRACQQEAEQLKAERNRLSKANGPLFGQLKKCADEAQRTEIQAQIDANNAAVKVNADRMAALDARAEAAAQQLNKIMLVIPQMIDEAVPIGPDDSANVEVQRFGEPAVPDFEIPYHTAIMERFDGIDMDAAGRVSGNGFYYLLGDIARMHEAVLAYGRDFMIDKGFTYCIPPFMIHGNVVEGVMSQTDMDGMMYKIEGEDLYLIGTSEHSMIGRFIDQILPADKLPQTLTSYSPCFRKEKGAHGIEERGIYRIHQFEKQEMIVVCRPEDSKAWYDRLWRFSVELFRSLDIPVRQLECCSGDLADLKCRSCDIEAWSPRQQKYFEVCSCSNLGDAQARRLHIRYKDESGKMQLCHTLNNTCVAPPRMLIALLENNLQADGSVKIPKVLQPYMGGKEVLVPLHD